jgi:hypothetical protein
MTENKGEGQINSSLSGGETMLAFVGITAGQLLFKILKIKSRGEST